MSDSTGAEGLRRFMSEWEREVRYSQDDLKADLDEAQATIAQQRQEIEALRRERDEAREHRRINIRPTPDGVAVCFGNHDRGTACEEVYYVPRAQVEGLREALVWYQTITADCNRHGAEGDAARDRLAKDRGGRARTALQGGQDDE